MIVNQSLFVMQCRSHKLQSDYSDIQILNSFDLPCRMQTVTDTKYMEMHNRKKRTIIFLFVLKKSHNVLWKTSADKCKTTKKGVEIKEAIKKTQKQIAFNPNICNIKVEGGKSVY